MTLQLALIPSRLLRVCLSLSLSLDAPATSCSSRTAVRWCVLSHLIPWQVMRLRPQFTPSAKADHAYSTFSRFFVDINHSLTLQLNTVIRHHYTITVQVCWIPSSIFYLSKYLSTVSTNQIKITTHEATRYCRRHCIWQRQNVQKQ